MSFQPVACVILICDSGSGCDPWDEEGGELHFDTEQQAAEWATDNGWTVVGNVAYCPGCTDRRAERILWDATRAGGGA